MKIDEYGYVIYDDTPSVENTNNTQSQTTSTGSNSYFDEPCFWYEYGAAFWIITLLISIGIALLTSMVFAPMIFGHGSSVSGFLAGIADFLYGIAPYAVFIGAIIGCIIYNVNGTKRCHSAHEYILSSLCAIAGAVGAGLIMFLLTIGVYIVAGILAVAIIIAVIVAIVSSN